MTQYLTTHFRYPTLNSWNRSTSYACNLKITHLGLSPEVVDKLFDMIQTQEFFDAMDECKWEFAAKHNYLWQAGMNGRSGGYLVLYQGEKRPSGYKSHCTNCGQRNYQLAARWQLHLRCLRKAHSGQFLADPHAGGNLSGAWH